MRRFVSLFFAALVLVSCVTSAKAQITVHSNPAAILIDGGASSPYPSVINVSGATTSISFIRVRLSGFSHTYPGDVQVLLVAPTGQRVTLMNQDGGGFDVSGITLDFSTDATALLPGLGQILPGFYKPTGGGGSLPSPAPASPYSGDLGTLNGLNANGTWTLYVNDTFSSLDDGSISGGWSITFNETARLPEPIGTAITYQGRLTGVPADSPVSLRFSLWNDPTSNDPGNRVGGSPIIRNVTLVDSVFTTSLDFGINIQRQVGLYLNIEASATGPGGPWTTLTPRQLFTGVPLALQLKGVTVDGGNRVGIGGVNDPAFSLDVNGRSRVRGPSGPSSDSPGLWFSSPDPTGTLIDRTFVGQRDDDNTGFFTGGDWRLRVHSNGNTWLGNGFETAPPERLTVTGNVLLNTPGRLQFGPVGDFAGTAENTDAVFFQRVNTSTPGVSNVSTLRLALGDDGGTPASADALSIGFVAGGSGAFTERIRLQSDGVALKLGGGTWAVLSDGSTKQNLAPMIGTLDKLLSLHGYSYEYKPEYVAAGRALPGTQVGLVAQDVQRVFPDWVTATADGKLCVTERATTALMIEALRDLRAEKDAVAANAAAAHAQIDAMKAENAELRARLEAIEAALKQKGR